MQRCCGDFWIWVWNPPMVHLMNTIPARRIWIYVWYSYMCISRLWCACLICLYMPHMPSDFLYNISKIYSFFMKHGNPISQYQSQQIWTPRTHQNFTIPLVLVCWWQDIKLSKFVSCLLLVIQTLVLHGAPEKSLRGRGARSESTNLQ